MARGALFGLLALCSQALLAVADTCSDVEDGTSIKVNRRFELDYTADQLEYWSTASGALKPSCIISPKSAEEVAAVVTILRGNNETFAIKSGGHNPNNYFASIDGGPLVSTKLLNEVILDRGSETARIGPGNRWDDVAKALDGTGYTAIGGRIGNVGVGGYMLGGGLSFMSAEYGWASNNVVEYELVLANSSIITVNKDNHPDIHKALQGGGNAFGVVTSYKVQVYEQGEVWGGNYVFNATDGTNKALMQAVRDFTEHYPDDKAGIILTAETAVGGLLDIWVMFLYYNGPEPPAGVFDNFTDIKPWVNNCKTRSYYDLLKFNNWAVVKGSVYTIGTETTPLPSAEHGAEIMNSYLDSWRNVSEGVQHIPGLIASVAFQPLPKTLARKAAARGGDLYDWDDGVDRIVLEFDYSFWGNGDFARVDQAMRDTYGGIRERVLGFQDQGKLPADAYLPLFANDGFYPQDIFGRLKPENNALAKRVRDDLDPGRLWADRTGGFKM